MIAPQRGPTAAFERLIIESGPGINPSEDLNDFSALIKTFQNQTGVNGRGYILEVEDIDEFPYSHETRRLIVNHADYDPIVSLFTLSKMLLGF